MQLIVRMKPIMIFYVAGPVANECRENCGHGSGPGFVTESLGMDGFMWDHASEFEADYETSFGPLAKNEGPDA